MTATLSPDISAAAPATTVGFENLLRSEWTKLRSLRSTYWSAAFVVLATVGLGIFMGARWAHQSGPIPPGFDSTNTSLSGVYIAQIIVGALGVLTISSEYATGMIRATFSAVPQRRTLLAAKAVVLAVATLVLAEAVCFVAFLSCQALLANKGAGVSGWWIQERCGRSSGPACTTAAALLGFGLGAAIRHTAGGLSAFFGLLFAPSAIVDLLPTDWRNDLINYMPANAGSQIFTIDNVKGALGPWAGLGVFCLYALAALVVGFVLTGVRDA